MDYENVKVKREGPVAIVSFNRPQSLNAIEAAQAAHPESETRYTICHIQVITDHRNFLHRFDTGCGCCHDCADAILVLAGKDDGYRDGRPFRPCRVVLPVHLHYCHRPGWGPLVGNQATTSRKRLMRFRCEPLFDRKAYFSLCGRQAAHR